MAFNNALLYKRTREFTFLTHSFLPFLFLYLFFFKMETIHIHCRKKKQQRKSLSTLITAFKQYFNSRFTRLDNIVDGRATFGAFISIPLLENFNQKKIKDIKVSVICIE